LSVFANQAILDILDQACTTHGPRELSQLQKNVATALLRIYSMNNWRSRISFKLQQNEVEFAACDKCMLANLALRAFWVV